LYESADGAEFDCPPPDPTPELPALLGVLLPLPPQEVSTQLKMSALKNVIGIERVAARDLGALIVTCPFMMLVNGSDPRGN
jgi:hypothetical protein